MGWAGSTLGAILGGQLYTLGCGLAAQVAAKLVLTRALGREVQEEEMQVVRRIAQPLFNANAVADTIVAISAALGAGLTTTALRVGDGFTLSEVNMGWKEPLMCGLITAIGTGIGTAISVKLLRRFFGTPNATIEQANIDRLVEIGTQLTSIRF